MDAVMCREAASSFSCQRPSSEVGPGERVHSLTTAWLFGNNAVACLDAADISRRWRRRGSVLGYWRLDLFSIASVS